MFRLFFAALLPSLLAALMVPNLAFSGRNAPATRSQAQEEEPRELDAVVNLADGRIDPAEITIRPGQRVRWQNKDDRDFSLVTSSRELKGFKSGWIKPGKSWDFRFEQAGTYAYHCSLRPRARGTVKVVAAEPEDEE